MQVYPFITLQLRYLFKFDHKISQDVFQENMNYMLMLIITGIIKITEDIIVFEHDLLIHDATLNALM